MARTRGAKSAPKTKTVKTIAEATAAASGTTPKVTLQPESTNPPKLFVLPKDTSSEARIALLENPKTSELSRYLCCPDKGFYEFTKVGPPKTTPRSWLIAPSDTSKVHANTKEESTDGSDFEASSGYVTKSSDLYIATPLDPLFLVLPALAPAPRKASSAETNKLFLSGDDYLDTMTTNSPQFRPLLRIESIRKKLEMRMASVCDTVDAGDEKMYRLNESKLFDELMGKASKMVEKGLPASMEEKFVRKALEVPVLSITLKRGESSIVTGEVQESAESKVSESALHTKPEIRLVESESNDSQSTTTSSTDSVLTTTTSISTATSFAESATSESPPLITPENVPHLLRLKTAFNFLISSYLPPHLVATLKGLLSNSTTPAFTELETHLKELAELRRKALEARAFSNDYSRKRGIDDEEYEGRAEKKRKLEEEEKRRKAGESRGVRELKKVNVSGMKKMSDFFKKKT